MPSTGSAISADVANSIKRLTGFCAILDRPHDADRTNRIQPIGVLNNLAFKGQRGGIDLPLRKEVLSTIVRYVFYTVVLSAEFTKDFKRICSAAFDAVVKLGIANIV